MLTAKDIQKILKVTHNTSYEVIRKLKKNNNLTYEEARISRKNFKKHYVLTDEEIDEALGTTKSHLPTR